MLVTFSCKAHANIVLFGDVAAQLLHMMGHSGTIPSALTPKEVPEALSRLQQALQKQSPDDEASTDDDQTVSIAHRAVPLIALLQDAVAAQSHVMWK